MLRPTGNIPLLIRKQLNTSIQVNETDVIIPYYNSTSSKGKLWEFVIILLCVYVLCVCVCVCVVRMEKEKSQWPTHPQWNVYFYLYSF